jgi:CubicO group peptidase (beta-lactamase class C family)
MQVYASGKGANMKTTKAIKQITVRHLLTHSSGIDYGFWPLSPIAPLYREHALELPHPITAHSDMQETCYAGRILHPTTEGAPR